MWIKSLLSYGQYLVRSRGVALAIGLLLGLGLRGEARVGEEGITVSSGRLNLTSESGVANRPADREKLRNLRLEDVVPGSFFILGGARIRKSVMDLCFTGRSPLIARGVAEIDEFAYVTRAVLRSPKVDRRCARALEALVEDSILQEWRMEDVVPESNILRWSVKVDWRHGVMEGPRDRD